jgi:acetyl esterase/lipase
MGYRLAPEVRFPDTLEDAELGLRYVGQRIGERVFLSGHSAGAMLAAWYALRDSQPGTVQGLALISGMYDISQHSEEIINRDSPRYTLRLWDAIAHTPRHTIIVSGDNDLPACLPSAETLTRALKERGASVEMFVEPNADHFQANRSFITPGGVVSEATLRMMGV